MNAKRRKILFISHDSTLTGAPILLYNLIRILVESGQYNISLLLYRGGVFEEKFRKLIPTLTLKPWDYGRRKGPMNRIVDYFRFRSREKDSLKFAGETDLIFSNTIVNGRLLSLFRPTHIPVATYVHELESSINIYKRQGVSTLTFENTGVFVSPCNAVSDNLVQNHNISQGRIMPLNYLLTPVSETDHGSKESSKKQFCLKYGISAERFLVSGMGTANARKGFDLFVETCRDCVSKDVSIQFIWVGGYENDNFRMEMQHKIDRLGLKGHLLITGFLPHVSTNLLPFDLFALTSREDPYPLVVLESALLKIPSICFKNGGGAADFVQGNCGWTIDDFSPQLMSEKILELKNRPDLVGAAGANAYRKVVTAHLDKELILRQFDEIVATATGNRNNS